MCHQKTAVAHWRQGKDPKRKRKSSRRTEDPPVSLTKPKKKKLFFPKRSWLAVILKKQVALEVFPRGRHLSPKRNELATLKRQNTGHPPETEEWLLQGEAAHQWAQGAAGSKKEKAPKLS